MTDVNLGFSEVVNIILSLFLGFQWLKDRSREKSIRHGLFGVREMVERSNSPSTPDILSSLDGNLATLGVRPPYTERCKNVLSSIALRLKQAENASLPELSPIQKRELEVK